MTEMNIYQALSAVMGDVQKVGKTSRNTSQNFNFRGIDAVMNTVGPALRERGVIVVPVAEDVQSETYETKSGTAMRNVLIRIRWVFYGPDGSSLEAVSYGEAADSGDKAVSKAHSVAYRTVLLQALCIPTDDPDPDASSHERVVSRAQSRPPQGETDPAALEYIESETAALTTEQAAELTREWLAQCLPNKRHLTPTATGVVLNLIEKVKKTTDVQIEELPIP